MVKGSSRNPSLSLLPQLSPHLPQQVSHGLNRPIRKCLRRLDSRYYIDAYTWDKSYNSRLQYAKLDVNMVQQLHQKKLNGITGQCNVPTMEEYVQVTTSFLGMGKVASFEWVSNDPNMVMALSLLCRLMNDIVSHKLEQEREHVPSSVECYMKQRGVSEEDTVKLFREEIRNAWKVINEERLRPTPDPMPLLDRIMNLARAMDVTCWKDGDGFTNSFILKDYVASLFKDPLP
ncbi:hypothetical protein MANES_03G120848v8 [Manihot esculenta]|uniref:Uncharacterized protein n=1 Tax=Manihot esculenta TaxID=3983 RepID=A0ACB7HZM8_MANES|nr:hypothetical protein MANES_03G120848v8 [Manihot esculenta]